jgi:hypothetical protein
VKLRRRRTSAWPIRCGQGKRSQLLTVTLSAIGAEVQFSHRREIQRVVSRFERKGCAGAFDRCLTHAPKHISSVFDNVDMALGAVLGGCFFFFAFSTFT